jgi:hypothetical protein
MFDADIIAVEFEKHMSRFQALGIISKLATGATVFRTMVQSARKVGDAVGGVLTAPMTLALVALAVYEWKSVHASMKEPSKHLQAVLESLRRLEIPEEWNESDGSDTANVAYAERDREITRFLDLMRLVASHAASKDDQRTKQLRNKCDDRQRIAVDEKRFPAISTHGTTAALPRANEKAKGARERMNDKACTMFAKKAGEKRGGGSSFKEAAQSKGLGEWGWTVSRLRKMGLS